MIIIHPTNAPNLSIFLDDEDADLSSYGWTAPIHKEKDYIGSPMRKEWNKETKKQNRIVLGRVVAERMNLEIKGKKVLYVDNNPLNAQRNNILVGNHSQMRIHSRKHRKISGYKGVYKKAEKKYEARVYHNKKPIFIGHFRTAVEAAIARDKKAKELYGEFAHLNFPH